MRGHSTYLCRKHTSISSPLRTRDPQINGHSSGITSAAWAIHLASEFVKVVRNASSVIVIARPVATGSTVTVPTCDRKGVVHTLLCCTVGAHTLPCMSQLGLTGV
jgi:hypothetical protein